jgi:seryl-tRNA synthetase
MLPLQFIREHPDVVRAGVAAKGADAPLDEILALDKRWREVQAELEDQRRQRGLIQGEIGRQKDPVQRQAAIDATRGFSERIKQIEPEAEALKAKLDELLLLVPNIPHSSVPVGPDESANVVVRTWGEPRAFDFAPQHHADLGEALGIIDFQRGAKLAGARFPVLRGAGARLSRALITFMLDLHTGEHGYEEVYPPFLVRPAAMLGTGQLPKLGADMYRTEATDEEDALYLIPTAEVPVTNLHADEILEPGALPLYLVAYSACFRREAGAAGRDTRGLYRVHQFTKVEMFAFCTPEQSEAIHREIKQIEEDIFKGLGLAFQVIDTATGDLGGPAYRKYDLEAWMPGRGEKGEYGEVTSTSNCTDYQARRLGVRYKGKNFKGTRFVHTLNGTAIACTRALVAVLENYQQADGSVVVPAVLRPWVGKDVITAERKQN